MEWIFSCHGSWKMSFPSISVFVSVRPHLYLSYILYDAAASPSISLLKVVTMHQKLKISSQNICPDNLIGRNQ